MSPRVRSCRAAAGLARPRLLPLSPSPGTPGEGRGEGETLYDALLDDYEPNETTANLRRVFDSLRQPLVDLVARVAQSGKKPPVEILSRHFPRDVQEKLCRQIAEKVGFDFAGGRIDVSAHPFSTGIAQFAARWSCPRHCDRAAPNVGAPRSANRWRRESVYRQLGS